MSLLEVAKFKYLRGVVSFESTSDWGLSAGEILVVEAHEDALVSQFLLVLAGLDDYKKTTEPARDGELIRRASVPTYDIDSAIKLIGQDVRSYTIEERALLIAYVFDNPELAVIGSDVAEEFRYSYAALFPDAGDTPSIHLLDEYGLSEKLARKTSVLSGGERHRLSVACAMERDCRLLFLDLSRSNLDEEFEEWLIARMPNWVKLRARGGGAAVVVSGISASRFYRHGMLTPRLGVLRANGSFEIDIDAQAEEEQVPSLNERQIGDQVVLDADDIGRSNYGRLQSILIKSGQIVAYHGPNGCGKTSIGLLLGGREKRDRFSGSFRMGDGVEPTLALQHPERSFLGATVLEEIEDRKLADLIGITGDELELHPRSLSYTKQKLLSIVVAIRDAKKLVILDEPSCGMNNESRAILVKLFNKFVNLAFLVFTHDPVLKSLLNSRELGKEPKE